MVNIIVGAQWGDEGKGKIIDMMASKANVVVRSQGGNNAGHTVNVKGNEYKLHLIPSGILYPNTLCLISSGVVLNPLAFLKEVNDLTRKGISDSNIYIDPRVHLIMPYHLELDVLSESARGEAGIGTTKKGIGPAYMDKSERSGIRFCDLFYSKEFSSKVRQQVEFKNKIIKLYGGKPLNAEEIIDVYLGLAPGLKKYMADCYTILHEAIERGEEILFEGAQGTLLDLDAGTYPYVTSSHPVSGGVCIGAGIGPSAIDNIIGIAKSYTTRVGKGPFPTELHDQTGSYIREKGKEYGTTTGRPRRCGWFDAVIVRYAVRVNGLTELVINKLDTLSGIKELKICTGYKLGAKVIYDFPADLRDLERCEPVYETFEGFNEDLSKCRSFDELPAAARRYIEAIEKLCKCRVSIIGVGPGRDQNIIR